ncbi:MAG: AsmA-like C-terminal domain-containing protein [Syntrophaceae bacterium]|nr:AsmA-like C-terminal domain-containing protein [Syntrophaceae bacterium]
MSTSIKKKSYGFRILVGLVLFGLFSIIVASSLAYFFINAETAGKYLTALIETRIGKKINYSDLSIRWLTFRNIQISLMELNVVKPDNNEPVFQAKEIDCDLDIGSLFFRSLKVKKLSMVKPTLFLETELTNDESFPNYEKNLLETFWLKPEIRQFELCQGSVINRNKSHSLRSSAKGQLIFSQLDIKFQNLDLSGVDSFEIRGRASESTLYGSFEMKGSFSSENPSDKSQTPRIFSAKFSDCPVKPFLICVKFFGVNIPISGANFSFAADGKFDSGKWAFSGVSIVSGGFIQSNQLIKSRVPIDKIGTRFVGDISDELISLDLQEISLPGAVASLKIQIKDRQKANSTLGILISRAEIDLKRISDFLPLSLFPVSERDRIKRADLKGHVQIVNSFWSNNLDSFRKGNFRNANMGFDIVLSNVSGFVPGCSSLIREASGFVRLNTTEVLFKGINLSLGNSPVVINGWISNLKTNPTVDLFVSANAYASDIRDVLVHKPFSQRFEPIFKNILEAQGTAAITMDVKGPLSDPSLTGRVRLAEIQFRIDGLPLPVRKLVGDIRFRGAKVSIAGIKGLIGDSPFEFKGDASQSDWNLSLDLKLGGVDVHKFSVFPSGWNVAGNTPVSLNVKGKPTNLIFSGTIDLSPTTIIYEPFVRKRNGINAKVEFSGIRNSEGISIEEAYLISEAGRISAKAFFKDDGKFLVLVNLPPKGIPTSSLIPFTDPVLELQSGGRLEGDFSIRKEKNQGPNFEANIIFSHVSLRLPRFRKVTEGITGVFQSKSKFINVTIERSRTGSSLVAGNFSIMDAENPRLKFSIESEFLDTTDFTAPPDEKSSVTWQEWIQTNPLIRFLARCKLSGNVHVLKGKTEHRSFDDFRSELNGVSGLVKVTKWQMNFVDGILRGSANFDIKAQTIIPFKLDFQGENLKFDRVFVSDPQRVKVDGDMNVHGKMEWKLRKSVENHGIYKTGIVDVVLTNGIIYRFEILSKIFSLINLGSLIRGRLPDIIGQGLPYQKITWKMVVFDNKWQFRNLKLLSDTARIDGSGMYFSDQNRIDFKAQVSPLVGLDAIVSGIFGNLITKDGKILTTTFRIRGLYSSPDIRLEPFENLKIEN